MWQDFPALEREIEISLHSRKQHHQAWVIYSNPDMFDRVKRAWAVWMLASYGCKLNGNFGYGSDAALADCTRKNGWHTVELRMSSSMTHGQGRTVRDKVEVLTANYQVPGERPEGIEKAPEIRNHIRFWGFPVHVNVRPFLYR